MKAVQARPEAFALLSLLGWLAQIDTVPVARAYLKLVRFNANVFRAEHQDKIAQRYADIRSDYYRLTSVDSA